MTLELPLVREASDEVDELRRKLGAAQALARVRGENLTVIAGLVSELRFQTAQLLDTSHSSVPFPPQGLEESTTRLVDMADHAARLTNGYAAVSETDSVCRDVVADLATYGWTSLPDRDLDGTMPPAWSDEREERRHGLGLDSDGYRRGWTRTVEGRPDEQLILWLTSLDTFKYATASTVGRLYEMHEVRAIVRADPGSITGTVTLPRDFRWPSEDSYYDGYGADEIGSYVASRGWTKHDEYHCDGHGRRRVNGRYRASVWSRPSNPPFWIYLWGEGGEPARCAYWAGPIRHPALLDRILRR